MFIKKLQLQFALDNTILLAFALQRVVTKLLPRLGN